MLPHSIRPGVSLCMKLVLETSGPTAHIVLVDQGRTVWAESAPAGRGHGGALFTAVRQACLQAPALDEIRVGIGPGSYSGCRQAIALAEGLAMARGIPLHGVCSLLALKPPADPCAVIADARHGMVYAAKIGNLELLEQPHLLPVTEIDPWAGTLPLVRFEHETGDLPGTPCAMNAARLAAASPAPREQSVPLEPLYLRPPAITQPKHRVSLLARD